MRILSIFSLVLILPALTACPAKNSPRQEHEGKKAWTAPKTPADESVVAKDFTEYDLQAGYAALKGDKNQLLNGVVIPLSAYVLNQKFIGDPKYRTPRLVQMINIFNTAFLSLIDQKDDSEAFKKIRAYYYQTVFSGCSQDLKHDCQNADLFSNDTRHTRIMTELARELDVNIEKYLKDSGGQSKGCSLDEGCAYLVEERYRLLAMGAYKRNKYDDKDFAFAYLKYARLNAEVIELNKNRGQTSHLAEVHTQIFDILIAKYQPRDMKDPEFRAFVENFNPWRYSVKTADIFQRGSRVMFGYAANCCLYQDESKTKLSSAVQEAIADAQSEKDSFVEMVKKINKQHGYRLFRNFGIEDLAKQILLTPDRFLNEFFFVVDRLYRGHLSTAEVEMVLANTNQARVKQELPRMITAYLKIQLAYMVLKTNEFFRDKVYKDVASNEVFEAAVTRSRELTSDWQAMQAQVDLLDRMLGSYFKGTFVSSEYYETARLIKALNRNIHYVSVYPNMIVMNYFFTKMKGKFTVNSWWGSFEIDADKILDAFFDGDVPMPWFRFGKDPERLNRPMLLYAFEYMLSTETLETFGDRTGFLNLIFAKYLDDNFDELRTAIANYRRETWGDSRAAGMSEVCNYELGLSKQPRRQEISVLDLANYTYAGMGDNSANAVLSGLVTKSASIASTIRDRVDYRLTYTLAMKKLIEHDLVRNGKALKDADGKDHPDLAQINANVAELEAMKRELAQLFLENHKNYFRCLITIREVERRRANRLYEEERAHLGHIYDLMQPLTAIEDAEQLGSKISEINAKIADEAKSYLADNGLPYDFDRVIDGRTFKMSKYNLLMRIRRNVRNDIFTRPTAEETAVYGSTLQTYTKARPVSIYLPEGLVRDEVVYKGTAITLNLRDTKEDFVRQGMVAFNGKSGSFLDWRNQLSVMNGPRKYIDSLIQFFLMGPIKGQEGKIWEVTKEELMKAYVETTAIDGMDKFDVINSRDFGADGLQTKAFFEGKLFEKDFVSRLPLFYDLMKGVYGAAGISLDGGPVFEALEFAQQLNNLQAFIFEPSKIKVNDKEIPHMPEVIKEVYGERAHERLNRVIDLFKYLKDLEENTDIKDATSLDPRMALPFYLNGETPVSWISRSKNLVDRQRLEDLTALLKEFSTRTGNLYKTREKVKAP